MNQACADEGCRLQTKYCILKNYISTQIILAPIGALRTMLREIGLVVLSRHPISQEAATILRRTRGVSGPPSSPSIGLQLQYWSVTRISYYTAVSHLLHSSYYANAPELHTGVMQYTGIVLKTLGFTLGQGAQGPPLQALRGLEVSHSITPQQRLVQPCYCMDQLSQLVQLQDFPDSVGQHTSSPSI